MKIVITGYTYTRQNLFDVFESYPAKEDLFFILPNNWTAKDGKVRFEPFIRQGFQIYHSPAFFKHSNYPVIGGLLKGWMPFFVFRLMWLRFTQGVDILFTTGEPNLLSTLYNAFWANILGMKHIFHFWENIPYEEKDRGFKLALKQWIIKINLALSDGALCGMRKAEDILKSFKPHLVFDTFLHAGLDPNRFKPGPASDIRQQYNLEGKTVFLFVGALGYRKGIHVALKALAEIKKKEPVRFLIVGTGEYKSELEKMVQELSLEEEVIFIPWIENEKLPAIYNAADIFVYPSIPHEGWEEQFGYSIAEASLSGLPIISTRTGSIGEVLIDGETGIMTPPDDVFALAEAMKKLYSDADMRSRMGKAGRELVKTRYSNEVIARKMFEFFKHVRQS